MPATSRSRAQLYSLPMPTRNGASMVLPLSFLIQHPLFPPRRFLGAPVKGGTRLVFDLGNQAGPQRLHRFHSKITSPRDNLSLFTLTVPVAYALVPRWVSDSAPENR